jgi:hypothetical protein
MNKHKRLTKAERRALGLAVPNPSRVQADQALRRSSAGSPHVKGPRTRADQKRQALKEYA